MNNSKQIIYLIPGWNNLFFEEYLLSIPTPKMLIEMLCPGCDPESVIVHYLTENEVDKISDEEKQSQSNLIKHNNLVISKLVDYLNPEDNSTFANQLSNFIKDFCNKNNLEPIPVLYELSVMRYINLMFLGKLLPNRKEITDWLGKVSSVYCKNGLDGLEELAEKAEIEKLTGNRKSLIGKEYIDSSILEERFPDYKSANDHFEFFLQAVNLSYGREHPYISLFRSGQNELTALTKNNIQSTAKQCPFCSHWFEVDKFSNGRIKSSFCGKKPCERKWDSTRKSKDKNENAWQRTPDRKRRFCEKCSNRRYTNKDIICKKCFNKMLK